MARPKHITGNIHSHLFGQKGQSPVETKNPFPHRPKIDRLRDEKRDRNALKEVWDV